MTLTLNTDGLRLDAALAALLPELSRSAVTILIGPTVPMCPALKDLGIERLSGMAVRDKAGIIDWMHREAGNPYPYGETFMIV